MKACNISSACLVLVFKREYSQQSIWIRVSKRPPSLEVRGTSALLLYIAVVNYVIHNFGRSVVSFPLIDPLPVFGSTFFPLFISPPPSLCARCPPPSSPYPLHYPFSFYLNTLSMTFHSLRCSFGVREGAPRSLCASICSQTDAQSRVTGEIPTSKKIHAHGCFITKFHPAGDCNGKSDHLGCLAC